MALAEVEECAGAEIASRWSVLFVEGIHVVLSEYYNLVSHVFFSGDGSVLLHDWAICRHVVWGDDVHWGEDVNVVVVIESKGDFASF